MTANLKRHLMLRPMKLENCYQWCRYRADSSPAGLGYWVIVFTDPGFQRRADSPSDHDGNSRSPTCLSQAWRRAPKSKTKGPSLVLSTLLWGLKDSQFPESSSDFDVTKNDLMRLGLWSDSRQRREYLGKSPYRPFYCKYYKRLELFGVTFGEVEEVMKRY